jgi:transcriptional regulator with XRE-family HTH domain
MTTTLSVGEKIKRLREASKISQTQLALFLCVDQSMISKIESNERSPGIELLEKLSVLFGCTDAYFETDDECQPSLQFAFRANEIGNEDFEAISAINRIALNLREMIQMKGDAAK